MNEPLLAVNDLKTRFATDEGIVKAVDGVSFDVKTGEVFAVVGESGAGKTVMALSILGLLPRPAGRVVAGNALFKGEDLLTMRSKSLRKLRGDRIAMIFQDPLTSFNPVFTVGEQIAEVIRTHLGLSRRGAWSRAVGLLDTVGIPRAGQRADDYPHQFSGGMRQRGMIAMAIALNPDLLIADEPTTALDVTVQAQILEVLLEVRRSFGTAIMLITHDLSVVAGIAERVMVMYAGKIAEMGSCDDIFYRPKHPYTWGLMSSITRLDRERMQRMVPIPGMPPSLIRPPSGCPFHPRCSFVKEVCVTEYPELRRVAGDPGHTAACHFAADPDWTPPVPLVSERAPR